MSPLLLATEEGALLYFDPNTDTVKLLFRNETKEGNMGLCVHKEFCYVASLSTVYKLSIRNWEVVEATETYHPSPDFHQMQIYDDKLYTTITKRNEIWVYDLDLNLLKKHKVIPPLPDQPVQYKKNYNHLNNIVQHEGRFWVNLNWLTEKQYGSSGVAVFDDRFNELERFEYGWETHDFSFMEGRRMALCGSSNKEKKLNHVYEGGLLVDGKLVFSLDPDKWFAKGLCWDETHIYLCGGEKGKRFLRKSKQSIICILEKNSFRLEKTICNKLIKSIKGAIVFDENSNR